MKPLVFVGSSLGDLREFPEQARRESGFDLWQVQTGSMPRDFKAMSVVGAGCFEIRIQVRGEWRVVFCAKRAEAVYVLHAFAKKTQTTMRADIEVARRRFAMIER